MSFLSRRCAAVARRSSYSPIAACSNIKILGTTTSTSTSTSNTTSTATTAGNRHYSSSTPLQKSSSPFYDFVNRYSVSGQQHRIAVANHLFRAAQFQAFQPHWYKKTNTTNEINNMDDEIGTKNAMEGEHENGNEKNSSDSNNRKRIRLGLASSLRQHHAMLTLHIWFLHRRLLAETQVDRNNNNDKNDQSQKGKGSFQLMIQEELFDTFWNDTQARIRAAGVHELSVNKFLKELQQQSMLQMTQYDHACAEFEKDNDREKRFKIICDGVWRHLLGGGVGSGDGSDGNDSDGSVDDNETGTAVLKDGIPDELIRRMGAYVEYQLDNIVFRLPDDYFDRGMVAWGSMPDLDVDVDEADDVNVGSKEGDGKDAMSGMDFLGGGDDDDDDDWVRVLNDAGEPYYWNMETNQVTWTEPIINSQ